MTMTFDCVRPYHAGTRSRLRAVLLAASMTLGAPLMTLASDTDVGIVRIPSQHSVAGTADRLETLLKEHGILLFARIDFSADASRAGLTMRQEQLLVFGSPKAGTPLMVSQPTAGLDLPLKALIWEDAGGKVWLAYNDPAYIVRRHQVPAPLSANLSAVVPILERATRP